MKKEPTVKPIIFSSEMVRALLDGRKTQTRLVMKDQPDDFIQCVQTGNYHPTVVDKEGIEGPGEEVFGAWNDGGEWSLKAPYKPGDLLWVRETAAIRYSAWNHIAGHSHRVDYKANEDEYGCFIRNKLACGVGIRDGKAPSLFPRRSHRNDGSLQWHPSIHMPRWASRLTLRVTNVRAERLQDISEDDARAEGAHHSDGNPDEFGMCRRLVVEAKDEFRHIWEALYHKDNPKAWHRNPWVWVYEFEVIRKNVGEVS